MKNVTYYSKISESYVSIALSFNSLNSGFHTQVLLLLQNT